MTTAAKNYARDVARHKRIVGEKAALLVETETVHPEPLEAIHDDELRLIFTCCHPVLTLDSQVALTLKVVAGFTTEEIARAFLSPEKTMAQRIVRAKKTIEEERLPYEVPERAELLERMASVLAVVYLLFNEGHTTRQGPLMRLDLQAEALRLGRLLCDLLPSESEVFGLFAALAELEAPLASYHLFYATRADFSRRLGHDARDDYRRALERAGNESERSFLRRRIDEIP